MKIKLETRYTDSDGTSSKRNTSPSGEIVTVFNENMEANAYIGSNYDIRLSLKVGELSVYMVVAENQSKFTVRVGNDRACLYRGSRRAAFNGFQESPVPIMMDNGYISGDESFLLVYLYTGVILKVNIDIISNCFDTYARICVGLKIGKQIV